MKLGSQYIKENSSNSSKIGELNRDIQDLKSTGEQTQGIHRRSPKILRYIHTEVDPLNANNLKGMGDDMNVASKGHFYDADGKSGSPELLSYRAYEHDHNGALRLHEHVDSSNLILPRRLSSGDLKRMTEVMQRAPSVNYLPAKYITEEQADVTKKLSRILGISPDEIRRMTIDSFPDQFMRVINDRHDGEEANESTMLISPFMLNNLPDNRMRDIIGENTSRQQDFNVGEGPTNLYIKGQNINTNNNQIVSSENFNGIFDIETNNFNPFSSGSQGSKEEQLFHDTLDATQKKIDHDSSLIKKINNDASEGLPFGFPGFLKINPFKNN